MPEIFLVFAICSLLIFGSIFGTRLYEGRGTPLIIEPMVSLVGLSFVVAALLSFHGVFQAGPLLYGSLFYDTLSLNAKGTLFLGASLSLWSSKAYLRAQGIFAFEYPLIILLTTLAMGILLGSHNFLSLYLALEIQSLGLYVLAAFKRGSAFSTEAGLKYFILGAFSSGLLLFGISLIYGSTGTVNFEDLGRAYLMVDSFDSTGVSVGLLGGLFFVSVGMLFKLAAAPFHMWIPDVYEGAPTSSTLYFALVPKLAILVCLSRVYYLSFYDFFYLWQGFLVFVSLSSMVVAALGALYQRKIKRFLAFSSIGHTGYILVALSTGSIQGLQALIVYTWIYMLMTLNVWTVLLASSRTGPAVDQDPTPIKYMDELVVVARENPALGVAIGVGIFSMAGIPPMAGFFAKLYVFFAALEASLYGLAIVGVLASVVGAYYYLRWIKIIYFEKVQSKLTGSFYTYQFTVDREKSVILSLTTFITLFFFINPGPILLLAHQMAVSVCL